MASTEIRLSPLKQTLQRIVLTVNRWPFGLYLTRLPYYYAIHQLGRMLKRHPLIATAYARNSFALGHWLPGRSDIDLTLIIGSGAPLADEQAAIRHFWRDYADLQRWLPMLGEVELLNADQLDGWTRFAITGYEARHWLLIYGEDFDRCGYCGDQAQQRNDLLNHAITLYRHQMAPVARSAELAILRRYVKKMLRYLDQPIDAELDQQLAAMSREALQARAVIALVDGVEQRIVEDRSALDLQKTFGRRCDAVVERGPSPASIDGIKELLTAVVRSSNDAGLSYYMPLDGLDNQQLIECITAANRDDEIAIIMPAALLIDYLHSVDPLELLALLQRRTVLWGDDPLLVAAPCSQALFHQAVCAYSVAILTLPYQPQLTDMAPAQFRDLLLGWVVRTARYHQDGVMEFDYDRLIADWQQRYPDDQLASWQRSADDPARRFELLRALTIHISTALCRSR